MFNDENDVEPAELYLLTLVLNATIPLNAVHSRCPDKVPKAPSACSSLLLPAQPSPH